MDISKPISTAYQFKDLTGKRFNMLTVLRCVGKRPPDRGYFWECRCDCGTIKIISSRALTMKIPTKSCGCLRGGKTTHGHSVGKVRSLEYKSWFNMIQRCTNIAHDHYKFYGGRGITVHQRYLDFQNFLDDLGPRPTSEHSIDRIDNNRGYEPGNLRWATRTEQMRNVRRNRRLDFNGENHTLSEWAEILGVDPDTLGERLRRGWSIEKALTTPLRVRGKKTIAPEEPAKVPAYSQTE